MPFFFDKFSSWTHQIFHKSVIEMLVKAHVHGQSDGSCLATKVKDINGRCYLMGQTFSYSRNMLAEALCFINKNRD